MIDLHTHSTVSDGTVAPGRIPELAAQAGCSAVALTDHDSLDGIGEARSSAQRVGIGLVAGCEVSCVKPAGASGSAHVLVYFVEPGEGALQDELANLKEDRVARNKALVTRLRELGIQIDYEQVVASAGSEKGVGRPHFARALVAARAADDVDDAFDRWLADGRPAYLPKARITTAQIATLARASGGVAVVAHPLSLGLKSSALESLVRELAEHGLAGMEAVYGRYSPEERKGLAAMAKRCGLVATGGSDFHGDMKPDLEVGRGQGDLAVSDDVLAELQGRRPA